MAKAMREKRPAVKGLWMSFRALESRDSTSLQISLVFSTLTMSWHCYLVMKGSLQLVSCVYIVM